VWVLDRRAPSAGQFAPFLDWMCASFLFSSFIRRLRLLFAARWSSCIVRTTHGGGVQPRHGGRPRVRSIPCYMYLYWDSGRGRCIDKREADRIRVLKMEGLFKTEGGAELTTIMMQTRACG